jgi:aerobic-type carbon monoxide dehydrogenase small subunit (CoxS/CutS family)
MENSIRFILNGQETEVSDPGRQTLLQYLRNVECLKGTKEACGTGHCGACSVLIDNQLARACVTPVKILAGRQVETIENLACDGQLSVIQQSFLDAGAVQCGFCTPGMVMATKALLLKNISPSEDEICEGLKNNYCRCTGYVKIIEAVKLAAARLRGEACELESVRTHEHTNIVIGKDQVVPEIEGSAVGRSVWDVDGVAKVTGALKYCDDFEADVFGEETMLHGAFVWAPAPHAKINGVSYEAVKQAVGVVRVLNWEDVPGLNKIGTWTPEQPIFCKDEVNFLGDVIALVIADTEVHARAAAKLAVIDYEELPGIYSMAEGHRAESYIVRTNRVAGDVETAKRDPEIVRIKVSKEIQPQEHACMEPISAIGYGHDGRVTVYSCTQAPFEIRAMLAKNLNLPEEKANTLSNYATALIGRNK